MKLIFSQPETFKLFTLATEPKYQAFKAHSDIDEAWWESCYYQCISACARRIFWGWQSDFFLECQFTQEQNAL